MGMRQNATLSGSGVRSAASSRGVAPGYYIVPLRGEVLVPHAEYCNHCCEAALRRGARNKWLATISGVVMGTRAALRTVIPPNPRRGFIE